MAKMGEVMAHNHSDFVDMLDTANVSASEYDAPEVLAEKYVDELPHNDQLRVLTAYMVADKDASNFDGNISNDDVYANFNAIHDYWNNDDFSNAGGVVGAIAGAVGEGAKLGGKIVEGRQNKKYGATNVAQKKADAKQELLKSVIAQKQAKAEAEKQKAEAKSKTTRMIIIGGSILFGLIAIGTTIYFVRKRK